jgi:two-component system sensor histidine kinase YesM
MKKKRMKNNTLKKRLLVYILPMVMIPILIVGVVSYLISLQIIINNATQGTKDLQIQTTQSIDYAIKQIEDMMDSPLYSDEFMDTVRNLQKDYTSQSSRKMHSFLSQVYYAKKFIKGAMFLTLDGHFYSISEDQTITNIRLKEILKSQWAQRIMQKVGQVEWDITEKTADLWNLPPGYIICSRLIRDTNTLEPMGFYVIILKPEILSNQYQNLSFVNNSQLLVLSDKGKVISDSKNLLNNTYVTSESWYLNLLQNVEGSFDTNIKGEKTLIFSTKIKKTGWKLVSLISYHQLTKGADKIKNISIIVVLTSMIVTFLFSLRYTSNIIHPVYRLIECMRRVKDGKFAQITNVDSYNEIIILVDNYNLMVRHIQKLLKDVYEVQITKQQLEIKSVRSDLKALQAQINPHFIYNTLECINVMAKRNGQQEMSRMILSLAKILHINLSNGDEVIAIRNELELIKEYMFIQKSIYQDSFQFDVNIPSNLQDYLIVKFTLQPLLENIIQHGFPDVDYKGVISLKVYEEAHALKLELVDNGMGMSEDRMEQLNQQLKFIYTEDFRPSIGYGILNVNSRIKLYFGETYGLYYENIPSGGLKVSISLLKIKNKEELAYDKITVGRR